MSMAFSLYDQFAILAVILGVLYGCIYARRRKHNPHRLPPGPRGLPLLGNIFQMPDPDSRPWEIYRTWSCQYKSDIIRVSALGTNIIVLNSLSLVNELLDKRSSNYSDRPYLVMFNDLCGFGWSMGGLPYGNALRESRKMARHSLHSHSVSQYRPHQLKTTRKLLLNLLNDAEQYSKAIRLWAGSTILSVSFGIDVQTHDDDYFLMAETASRFTIDQLAAGSRLVDAIPILKHVPEWVPGAAFKREARRIHAIADRMLQDPLNLVHSRMNAGHLGPCAAKALIEAYGEGSASAGAESADYVIRSTLGSLYIAGAETNIAALETFFLAMVLYPHVQRTAWEEIDRVVGPHRLPDFRDQAALPYITAVMKETLRWRPIAPLAVPHMATEDDTYGDYFIPKGSIVVANSWSILHDESIYPNPSHFSPNRFLNADGTVNTEVQDPTVAAFGFGRRICPGRFLALESLWIGIVSVLATFEIARAVDENGAEIVPDGKFTGGVISSPKPFKCDVRPRSEEHASLLQYVDPDEQDV